MLFLDETAECWVPRCCGLACDDGDSREAADARRRRHPEPTQNAGRDASAPVASRYREGGLMPDFAAWDPDDWSALASCVTALTAVLAAIFVWRQVREAQQTRREQAQPYVVAWMESSAASPHIVDVVVKNFGSTAAYDIRLTVTPGLLRSGNPEPEEVWVPDDIPLLVPGQEWRTMWDTSIQRFDSGLPDRHDVELTFKDSKGSAHTARCVMDWAAFKGRRWVTVRGLHDAASALRDIRDTMSKWKEGIHGGVRVTVRDGDRKDAERKREYEALIAGQEETDSPVQPDETVE
jgi:hypothetical protein